MPQILCISGQKPAGKRMLVVESKITPTAIGIHHLYMCDRYSHYNFLIDSGFDISCIPAPRGGVKQTLDPLRLFVANDTKIYMYGTKVLKVDLGL